MSVPEDSPPLIAWDDKDGPRSLLYGDLYFSRDDGLSESRAVFLGGCDLPRAWAGRTRFCVAELGFGTGLNIVALLDLWRQFRPADGRLHVFSVDAHPLAAVEAARALSHWPQIAPSADALISRWPGRARGFHRIDLPHLYATVDLAVMEAEAALEAWEGVADGWFLDGFAPALNPAMWRPEVLRLIAARSAPDARLASYTVAGSVRRGLAEVGFAVERCPGFGKKRERLEGRLAGDAAPVLRHLPAVAVIGAGIAGMALCRAFGILGVTAQLFDAVGVGAGASGGPAALAAPRLDAGLGPAAALFAQAMRTAVGAYAAVPGAVIDRQALQLQIGPKDPRRFAAVAGSEVFEPGGMSACDAPGVSAHLGESAPAGLKIDAALVVEPARVLAAWSPPLSIQRVASITACAGGWRLSDTAGNEIAVCEIVCVAAGMDSAALIPNLNLTPVRGQASVAEGLTWPIATLFGGYVVPTRTGMVFGATHDRDDTGTEPRDADHLRNLAAVGAVLPGLSARLATRTLQARTGVRATTSDYLPLAGAASPEALGVFVLTGLGSRGYCLAPLLAEHVAALALGAPSPMPKALGALVDPARFAARARRKARGSFG